MRYNIILLHCELMIQLKEASFGYKHQGSVLKDVNLEIQSGRFYGLVGGNGEGKTTLLNILCGQQFLQSGICRVFGEDPVDRSTELLEKLFILPEKVLLPDITAMDYIKIYAPYYPTFSEEILQECIRLFCIEPSSRLSRLSEGQQKKVAITLALSVHTPLLLMDEPTNGLDISSKRIFRKLLASFSGGMQTVIISTHLVSDLENLIDDVIILHNKEVLLNKSLSEIGDKLHFGLVDHDEPVMFQINTPFGTMGVGENTCDEVTSVSLELLFNVAIQYPDEIKRIFKDK